MVAKFYRPERLSDAALIEEHRFAQELQHAGVAIVAPLARADGETLHHHQGFSFALYPRIVGRAPEMDDPDTLFQLGQLIGQLHAVGGRGEFQQRAPIGIERLGYQSLELLRETVLIPVSYRQGVLGVMERLLGRITEHFAVHPYESIRLHGDIHAGNILHHADGLSLVDTDDCGSGPAMQDLWILLSGERTDMQRQLREMAEGYEESLPFPTEQLALVEGLRALRMIHYNAWLARRWSDPTFPIHFPWFGTPEYWQRQQQQFTQQLQRLQQPALSLMLG